MSELKENKNPVAARQNSDAGFVSEIVNNPEQRAFAGTPLKAAKLKKKNRLN